MCDYTGHEFGASYPDSCCIDGFLWDLDSGDSDGLTHGGDMACPRCNTAAYLEEAADQAGSCGVSMTTPWCGAILYENAMVIAKRENPAAAAAAIAAMPPVEASDWPDRQAVREGRARWDGVIDVLYLGETQVTTRAALTKSETPSDV